MATNNEIPSSAPPSYEAATSSNPTATANTSTSSSPPHKTRNGIPPSSRRSMEDESRPLPTGWVRSYDPHEHHQFFVDTTKEPPRSIWSHPYDDDIYMNSLSPEERQRIQGLHRVPSQADIEAESSEDDEHHEHRAGRADRIGAGELPPRPGADHPTGIHKFGRKMKDKITGSTHIEREQTRLRRAEEERHAYAQHQAIRQAMSRAIETGEPQLLGKDRQGKDVYIEAPQRGAYGGGFGGGYGGGVGGGFPGTGGGFGGHSGGGYGDRVMYNPYQHGPYANPNARIIRPQAPYSRPYGYGYGGGLGLPLALGLGGGLLGGSLLF